MKGNIYIPKPCHENWNKMTTAEKGRHCDVCSKVVADFTKMKTEEIVNALKSTDGEVCGRIGVKNLTPANKKQKVYFWINGVLFRKSIYPIMALLGVTFLNKKAAAQTGDYQKMGKMVVNNYHTNAKKITVVVKTNDENKPIANATIRILSGIKNHPEELITDANGKIVVTLEPEDVISSEVEIEIIASGYEPKTAKIKAIKDIQTIEIRMEEEMMMMGEMMYIPPTKTDEEIKVNERDSMKKIEITKCSILTIKTLPQIPEEIVGISVGGVVDEAQPETANDNNVQPETVIEKIISESPFNVFPVPSTDHVNIVSSNEENFNMDVFDGSGKKIHTVVNSNSRYTLDVSAYAPGVYYVLLTVNGKAVKTKKIIVTR